MNSQHIKKEIKRKIKSYIKTNKNGNTTYQNLWDIEKVGLRGKFMVLSTYIKKLERLPKKKNTPNFIPQLTRKIKTA